MAQMSPQGPVQGWVQMVPCGKCGQAIDPTKAVYSKQGELMCRSCESSDIVTEGYLRAARTTCYGALGSGVLSIFFNPIYIFSIAAIVGGIRALTLINRPEYRSVLQGKSGPFYAAAIGGLLAGCVQPTLRVLATMAYLAP